MTECDPAFRLQRDGRFFVAASSGAHCFHDSPKKTSGKNQKSARFMAVTAAWPQSRPH